jgi:adenine-specific DNA-methyltransferase
MQLQLLKPSQTLNKAYLKEKTGRAAIEIFKTNLLLLISRINEQESEEHLKNVVSDFLKDTWYKGLYEINTKDRKDLVIHTGKTSKEPVGVILEVKKPANKAEMISGSKPNAKALHEMILYYLRETTDHANTDIKYLIITNIYEWYIFDENWFLKNVYRNTKLKKDYDNWKLSGKDTRFFYENIAKPFVDSIEETVECTWFDIRSYNNIITNSDTADDKKLIALYKILSPVHLLKQRFANDSNSLDTRFYAELLYIIGLEEVKEGGKKLIQRKAKPDHASLLENAMVKIHYLEKLGNVQALSTYGSTTEEQTYNIALELCITWINRILFLKLLEAQLYKYHKADAAYLFLNSQTIYDFDELSNLFFQVLAEKTNNRRPQLQAKFKLVPYLNSSLFDRTVLEKQTIDIGALDNRLPLPLQGNTVLKDAQGKRSSGTLPTLQYLFEFLDAYDFTSEGAEEIQEDNKNLINASVLGLIFEKINGYKDGSFFTPGFVTMYMCRETIRRAVYQKFNDAKGWNISSMDTLYNKIDNKTEANAIINSLTICDPAVGSGHFLVSALNEIIAIKSELQILVDRQGKVLRDYEVEVVNDELIVTFDKELIAYNPNSKESQRIQETLFHEKQTVIENCLFGVDINPNSVKICRLRLWIELLKSAYYKQAEGVGLRELETLPNIDINIKCGNSLISRFALDADIKATLRKSKWTIDGYKVAVQTYRDAESKEEKREMESLIDTIKKDFRSEIVTYDPINKKLNKLRGELFNLTQAEGFFSDNPRRIEQRNKDLQKLSDEIEKIEKQKDEIKNNKIFGNAFEWRFEFPEVLNMDGDFLGFDVMIGNPPYLRVRDEKNDIREFYQKNYQVSENQLDLYHLFIEQSNSLVKNSGTVSIIIPNAFLANENTKKLRRYILDNCTISSVVDIRSNVFEEASVDVLILFLQKGNSTLYSQYLEAYNESFFEVGTFEQINFYNNQNLNFTITLDNVRGGIIKKISKLSYPLLNYFEVSTGIKEYQVGKGSPKQTEFQVKNKVFNSSEKLDKTYLPELRGKNLSKYFFEWRNEYISYGEWIAEPRSEHFFSGEKILIRQIPGKESLIACYVKDDFIVDQTAYVAKKRIDSDINFSVVLSQLNSKLIFWYFQNINNEFDKLFPKIKVKEFKNLPIKIPSAQQEASFENLVNQILSLKNKSASTDTSLLENEIDKLVYELYELTEEEIRIIEG